MATKGETFPRKSAFSEGPQAPLQNSAKAKNKTSTDYATLFGLIGGIMLIGAAIAMSGSSRSFFNFPSILIVFGGTFAATLMCYSFKEFRTTSRSVITTFIRKRKSAKDVAMLVLSMSEVSRNQGLLPLERYATEFKNDPLFGKALRLLVDNAPAETTSRVLSEQLQTIAIEQRKSVEFLRKSAEFAPAMGLIGTLIGLIQMLSKLHDPSNIGPSMAVALLTTFYGAILANFIFSPLASKLEKNATEDFLNNRLFALGAEAILKKMNPRDVEVLLNSTLAAEDKITYFKS